MAPLVVVITGTDAYRFLAEDPSPPGAPLP